MKYNKLGFTLALALSFGFGLACSDDGAGGEVAGTCEPGEVSDCACTDGSAGEQVCADDGMSYGDCSCEGGETGGNSGDGDGDGDPTGDGDGDPTGDGDGDPTGDGDGDPTGDGDGDPTGDGDGESTGDGDGDPAGDDPIADIFHPGDGEVRPVNVPIAWIGDATDTEDGQLGGTSVVWTSDLEGEIGTGLMFDAPLSIVGVHTITMTATDSDAQQGVDTLQLTLE